MKKIVLFGDAILGGVHHERVTDCFTNRIQNAFADAQIINCSIPGHKTSDALTHFQRDVVNLQPDIVVLFFGANDILTTNEMKPGYFTNNLSHMITEIGPQKVVLVSPPYVDYHKHPDRSWPRQLQFALAAEQMAKSYHLPFVNLLDAMQAQKQPEQYLQADGLHFNESGYDLLERLLVPAIKQAL
ncbi:lipase [Bombilactobacillus bombi]|uniref:Lipase n=1 Tax=Bombilactobacillus bombi TaxID=1303590 RepID=A0A417ZHP3_9LACO|nr:GDSL-type esterase/lipase family protein [Bombilactobacillus bombi]RHW51229.1 lipase [Bombilactobacillus bombi]